MSESVAYKQVEVVIMTRCKGKRRIVLAAIAASAVFSGSTVFAKEVQDDTQAVSTVEETAVEEVTVGETTVEETAGEETTGEETTVEVTNGEGTAQNVPQQGQNGWVTEGSNTYYYIDGEKVTDTIMEIDGYLYAFSASGVRIEGYSTSLSIGGKVVRFRAKADGKLYRSEWYSYTYNGVHRKWYFGDDGNACSGICTISGQQYLFSKEGELMMGMAAYHNGTAYAGDEEGHPTALKTNGWDQVGGSWFYLKNGQFYADMQVRIGSTDYFFRDNGDMLDDNKASHYDSASKEMLSYRAKPGGKLYRNEWCLDEYGSWFYYGDDFAAKTGFQHIGKKDYYFNLSHELVVDAVTYVNADECYYISDKNGYAIRAQKDGWYELSGVYFFIKDGSLVKNTMLKIGNTWYGFQYSGAMYDDAAFEMQITEEDGEKRSRYFRAKAGGALVQNSWYQDEEGNWYYYDSMGRAATGICKIGNKNYAFDSNGKMLTGGTVSEVSGLWLVSSDGTATLLPENQWTKINDKWYYNSNGELLRDTIRRLEGERFYFDSDGVLAQNRRFTYQGDYYRAGEKGVLLVDTWYGYEYYGEDGASMYNGVYTVNGKKYYFQAGIAQKNTLCYADGSVYLTASNGVATEVKKDGVYYIGSDRVGVCVKDGKPAKYEGWEYFNGQYYYHDSDAFLLHDGTVDIDGKLYSFTPEGILIRNGWFVDSYGSWRYAKGSGELVTGVQKLGGKYYYFGENGVMQTGLQTINGKNYLYGNDGVYVGEAVDNSWNQIGGKWYYIKNGTAVIGQSTINKVDYSFDYYGVMQTDCVYSFYDYIFGSNGKRITKGWYYIDGFWYYVDPSTGRYVSDTTITIGKNSYAFDYEGRLKLGEWVRKDDETGKMYQVRTNSAGVITEKEVTNSWAIDDGHVVYTGWKENGWIDGYYIGYGMLFYETVSADGYYVDKNGKKDTTSGWKMAKNPELFYFNTEVDEYVWFYVKVDGRAARSELLKIGASWYYFDEDGIMQTGACTDGNKLYLLDASGKWQKTVLNPADGWYAAGGKWFYVEDGALLSDVTRELDGKYYHVDQSGQMVTDQFEGYYLAPMYFGSNGQADLNSRGWVKKNGKQYYFGIDGRAQFGLVRVGSKTYYITPDEGCVTGYRVIGYRLYQFGTDGALIREVHQDKGWLSLDGSWYYFENGEVVSNGIKCINGKTYVFAAGRLYTDGLLKSGGICSTSSGELLTNSWKQVGKDWYYFDERGKMTLGYRTIGNKLYHFGGDGKLIS